MLLIAVGQWPYAYYQVMRLLVCAAAVFVAYKGWMFRRDWAVWVFGSVAVLFNPICPFHMNRAAWMVIDLLAAATFILAIIVLHRATKTADEDDNQCEGFGWMFISAVFAIFCFCYAYDAYDESRVNQEGGNVPIYAGRRDPEVVGEQWVDSESYTQYLRSEMIISTVIGVISGVFAVGLYRELRGKRFLRHKKVPPRTS
jgi:hypothetical protein